MVDGLGFRYYWVTERLAANDLLKFVMKINSQKDKVEEYPFRNQINGFIEDAVCHCRQKVSFRRSSENPFSKGVSLLTGKVKKVNAEK